MALYVAVARLDLLDVALAIYNGDVVHVASIVHFNHHRGDVLDFNVKVSFNAILGLQVVDDGVIRLVILVCFDCQRSNTVAIVVLSQQLDLYYGVLSLVMSR